MLIFVRLIFVAAIDYENIFTTKISRLTVCITIHMDDAFILNCFPMVPMGYEEQVSNTKCTGPFLPLVKGLAPRLCHCRGVYTLGPTNNDVRLIVTLIRPGKLNLQFIVTACMDFQIFSKNFRFQIVYSNYNKLWYFCSAPRVLQLKGVAMAIACLNPAFLALFY